MASGSLDKTICIWRVLTGELIKTLLGHKDFVNTVSFYPNGEYLASGSKDNTIGIWKVSTGELVKSLRGHSDGV